MKKSAVILITVLALTTAILLICAGISANRAADIKNYAAATVFFSVRVLDERLGWTVSSGEYTLRDSQIALLALAEIETAVDTAEKLYTSSVFAGNRSFLELADALGCSYYAAHNNVPVESILYDGELSEKELRFLAELSASVHDLLEVMLDEDGLNMRGDLTYDEIRKPLSEFVDYWGFWSSSSDAPYELLNSDDAPTNSVN